MTLTLTLTQSMQSMGLAPLEPGPAGEEAVHCPDENAWKRIQQYSY